jgi:hypothetical protein
VDTDIDTLCRALRIVAADESAKIPHGTILTLKELDLIVVKPDGRYCLSERGAEVFQRIERGDVSEGDFRPQ